MKKISLLLILIFSQQAFCDYKVIMIRHAEKETALLNDYFKQQYPNGISQEIIKAAFKKAAALSTKYCADKLNCVTKPAKLRTEDWAIIKKHKAADAMLPLSRRGWERANALAAKFSNKPPINFTADIKTLPMYKHLPNLSHSFANAPVLGKISAIFAKGTSKNNDYVRTMQTVAPTVAALKLPVPVNTSFGSAELDPSAYKDLVATVRTVAQKQGDKATILISWEHHSLPYVAQALANKKLPKDAFNILTKWPDTVFDQIWVLHFDSTHNLKGVENMPQMLLFGDSKVAMDGKNALAKYNVSAKDNS